MKCKYESEKVKVDSSINLANSNSSRNSRNAKQQLKDYSMSESEGFVLRPRSRPPKSSEAPPIHQSIVREVMGKEGQRYRTKKRSGSAEPEDDEIVIDKKSNDNVVQRTTRHSTVTEFPLPYVEDGGTAAAEATFSQSEDMLEHLCVDK